MVTCRVNLATFAVQQEKWITEAVEKCFDFFHQTKQQRYPVLPQSNQFFAGVREAYRDQYKIVKKLQIYVTSFSYDALDALLRHFDMDLSVGQFE
jgi:hypothetical protein